MSEPHPHDEPTLDVAHGDPALARHLREILETLRRRSDNDDFRRVVDDVLAGRASLRDVYSSAAFAAGLDSGVRQFARRYDELSEQEREELAAEGARELRAERERIERGRRSGEE